MNSEIYSANNTLAGLQAAVEIESKARLRVFACAKEVDSSEAFTIISLENVPVEFSDVSEGWIVRGEYLDDEVWFAEIIDVDHRYPVSIVVKSDQPVKASIKKDLGFLENDFLKEVRDWAKNKASSKDSSLPASYLNFTEPPLSMRSSSRDAPLSTQSKAAYVDLEDCAQKLKLRESQKKAIELSQQNSGIIWGPPGTGKTYTLAALVMALRKDNAKILVLAPTNIAADNAALAIDAAARSMQENLAPGALIRPGFPQLEELEEKTHIMSSSPEIKQLSQAIRSTKVQLQILEKNRRSRVGGRIGQQAIAALKSACREDQSERSRILWGHANNAQVIVTTLQSAINNQEVFDSIVDDDLYIIIDEASMLSRFLLARILDLSPDKIFFFGDFNQLGPVCKSSKHNSNSVHWIADSALSALGIRSVGDALNLEQAGQLVMLSEQSRMQPQLSKVVSDSFYAGRLSTVGQHDFSPVIRQQPNTPIVIADPSKWRCFIEECAEENFDFRPLRNVCSDSVVTSVSLCSALLNANQNVSAMILSPFRNQASQLRKFAYSRLDDPERWVAGTVHVSQGRECDYVILSPVRPSHPWICGLYGTEEMERLLCVAFSRARKQVIVVADPEEIGESPLLKELCNSAATWSPV